MEKIIDGVIYESFISVHSHDVTTWLQNGQREVYIQPTIFWRELCNAAPASPDQRPLTEDELSDKLLAQQKSSARRAQKNCRRAIKVEGFDTMLTLTYRENMLDFVRVKRDFRSFYNLIKKHVPAWRYVATFERQERGSWHVHIAVHKSVLKGLRMRVIGTQLWRRVVGPDNGLCFVGSGSGSNHKSRMSVHQIANYLAKYLTKSFDGCPPGSNRFTRSIGNPILSSVTQTFVQPLSDLIAWIFDSQVLIRHGIIRDTCYYYHSYEKATPLSQT